MPDDSFSMLIDDAYFVEGRGWTVEGHVFQGKVKIGDKLEIAAPGKTIGTAVCAGVEKQCTGVIGLRLCDLSVFKNQMFLAQEKARATNQCLTISQNHSLA